MGKLIYVAAGEEFLLEAIAFNYPSVAEKYIPLIQWEMTPENGTAEIIGTGKSVKYKIPKKYAGKKVVFRAYINKDSYAEFPLQRMECMVETQPPNLLIKEVKGSEKAFAGETVEFRVTKYNVDGKKLTTSDKKAIKWDVKIGDDTKKVLVNTDGLPYRTDRISLVVSRERAGKEVVVMPYFRSSTESIAVRMNVYPP
jgi:hypothetical protein